MTDFDDLRPLETGDEEYGMLLEVTEEFQKQEKGSPNQKSGKATQKVIHKHLIEKMVNLPVNPEVKIREVKTRMDLLFLLKMGTSRNELEYSINDIGIVLKVTNNAVGKTTSENIRRKFEEFARFNPNLRFAVVVLSERLSYLYPITFDKVFTLVARKKKAHQLYLKETIIRMQKNGDLRKPTEKGWEELQRFLSTFPVKPRF